MEGAKAYYELMTLNTADIKYDKYQRPLDQKLVRKIVAHWNGQLVNIPKVSFRGGKYYAFDGQHTIEAMKLRNDGKDVSVVCKVYEGLTYEDEARLFAAQNGISKNVTTHQRVKALFEAKDPDTLTVIDCVIRHGYPDPVGGCGVSRGFKAFTTAMKIYEKFGIGRLDQILEITTGAWGIDPDGCKSSIMVGINIVLTTFYGEVDTKELIKCLSRVNPIRLDADAKADTTHAGTKRHAFQIVKIYNKKRKYRLDEREI